MLFFARAACNCRLHLLINKSTQIVRYFLDTGTGGLLSETGRPSLMNLTNDDCRGARVQVSGVHESSGVRPSRQLYILFVVSFRSIGAA